MSYSIKKYQGWLLEEKSKRYAVKEGGTKVVFKPIDQESFLIKYRKLAVVDSNQILIGQPKLVNGIFQKPQASYLNTGWQQTLDLLLNSPEGKGPSGELVDALGKLGTEKILVYEVSTKLLAPNKIFVTFTIYDKAKFKAPIGGEKIDPDIKTLEASTAAQYAVDNATAAKIRNTALNLETKIERFNKETSNDEEEGTPATPNNPQAEVDGSKTGVSINVSEPQPFSKLRYATASHSLFKIINKALAKISRFSRQGDSHPEIYDNDKFKKSEEELEEGKIGDYVITVLTALKKAYGIITKTERGVVKDYFNQEFANKLADIINAKDIGESAEYILDPLGKFLIEAKLYEDKLVDLSDILGGEEVLTKFADQLKTIAVVTTKKEEKGTSATTPEELANLNYDNLKSGKPINDDVKKVQKFIIDKFNKTQLGPDLKKFDEYWYNRFIKFGDDGDYGTTTKTMISYLNQGILNKEGDDGSSISKELIAAINNKYK